MCGIAAVINLGSSCQQIDHQMVERMRDRLTYRGPDDSGLYSNDRACIGHRRLIVIDPTPAGHQPMSSPDARFVLAYNGELYNDHDLRSELGSMGVRFRTACDTETLLHALITWGDDAIDRLRGMFAFVLYDTHTDMITMARDPLGIKPLYYSILGQGEHRQLAIASEIPALLEHPGIDRTPDPITLSAYLSSIRTTLGTRTMFESIQTLEPGDWVTMSLKHPPETRQRNWWDEPRRAPTQGIRQTIEESVHRHLRTDVPMCTLLSGGLDSAIIATLAMRSLGALDSYCSGARSEGFDDDFAFAARMADRLGTHHHEIEVTQETFVQRLPDLINRLGNPVSTPNEIAIYEVASALRAQGHVVTLSGEGADELFAGYAPIMQQCAAHVAQLQDPRHDPEGGLFHLRANAWISEELKPAVLQQDLFEAANGDDTLRSHYRDVFNRVHTHAPTDSPLQAHLQFQRRMNLPNLLQRLDTSTMLAGVEGRTPFADLEVAIAANALLLEQKYRQDDHSPETKIALRRAFASDLPDEVVRRPKASFPLPFQHWLAPFADLMNQSPFARTCFTEQSLSLVCSNPTKYWHMAWPMVSLTLWGHAWLMSEPIDSMPSARACAPC